MLQARGEWPGTGAEQTEGAMKGSHCIPGPTLGFLQSGGEGCGLGSQVACLQSWL